MTYADITENFDGGGSGDLITTANTAFPRIDDQSFGGSKFVPGGAVGQGAAAVVPADPSTQPAGSGFFDSHYTDATSTIAADDWTARGSFRIGDSTSVSDPGYGVLNVFVGEVGRTPANWGTGTSSNIDANYNVGDKTLTIASPGIADDTFSIAAYLGTWITIEINGTNGSFDYSIRDAAGAVIHAVTGAPITAGLYRARCQASTSRSVGQTVTFDVDFVYFGRTIQELIPAPNFRRRRGSPLRRYPRSPLRRYPPPPSTQDSNRRAGGYQ